MSEKKKYQEVSYIDNEIALSLDPEKKKIWDEMFVCRNKIEEIVRKQNAYRNRGYSYISDSIKLAAYLLAKASESSDPINYEFETDTTIDADVMLAIQAARIGSVWNELKMLMQQYRTNIFYLVANLQDDNDPNTTPRGISYLSEEILDVKSKDRVIDLGCGRGNVAFDIKRNVPEAKVFAIDINQDYIAIAKLMNELSLHDINIEGRDMFELGFDDKSIGSFDKVFSNYPFGTRSSVFLRGSEYFNKLREKIPSMSRGTSSDWIYNALMMDLLTDNGKAVGIMTNGGTWNTLDIQARKYFIENGYIECVISLPERIFSMMNVATSIIVMSHNNKGVRLVDASKLYVLGRRINELSDENVEQILAATKEDSDISQYIDMETLRSNEYVLNLSRYLDIPGKIEDGRSFKEVIKVITRGAPLNARVLDDITSQTPTNMQYLMIANVHDGFIDRELPYLKEISKNNQRYCLKNHCLILSKNGYPYKIAVAEVKDDQQILANGNLYVIELDEDKVNPYYVAAYLSSEQGTALLKRITVGATIPNIGVEQLKEMIIPVPPMDKQMIIADKYLTAKNEIEMLQIKLEKAKDRFAHAYEEGRDE